MCGSASDFVYMRAFVEFVVWGGGASSGGVEIWRELQFGREGRVVA